MPFTISYPVLPIAALATGQHATSLLLNSVDLAPPVQHHDPSGSLIATHDNRGLGEIIHEKRSASLIIREAVVFDANIRGREQTPLRSNGNSGARVGGIWALLQSVICDQNLAPIWHVDQIARIAGRSIINIIVNDLDLTGPRLDVVTLVLASKPAGFNP